ncbi:hypothetical protein BO86DRAFT_377993 [Aspergillus japonicus CBS 114.51]|uniref:Uncharacterized protein n=1 Tax=Aspergillus japonicus CBS 114.51 TaxID=1448312 RepID=A0A8T8X703_ASPJA|nr:hypothetical protein BO86DRAFT_377993 [Aspergillus japonicus CBS 114.51]RAH83422.1 hypothetical protein BO86DRAFT_377993 [Aspergillus japonicus CBS 114.51]
MTPDISYSIGLKTGKGVLVYNKAEIGEAKNIRLELSGAVIENKKEIRLYLYIYLNLSINLYIFSFINCSIYLIVVLNSYWYFKPLKNYKAALPRLIKNYIKQLYIQYS